MNSPILPIEGSADPVPEPVRADEPAPDVRALASELAGREAVLAPAARRGGPPREVLDQIESAAGTGAQLRALGHQVRFFAGADGQRTRIEIQDRDGNAVRSLSVSEVVALADGRPLG